MALTEPEKYHDLSGKVNRIPERIETFLGLNVALIVFLNGLLALL